MAGRYHATPSNVRLPQQDHEWLARLASHEHTSVQVLVNRAIRHFRSWETYGRETVEEAVQTIEWACGEYEAQLARERSVRLAYEQQLRRERGTRRACERHLQRERDLRRAYEERLRRQRRRYERQPKAETDTNRDALYGSRVAKLLALAICCQSDGEAETAFAKARLLHRRSPSEAL
jgi:hypothetical protein